MENAAHHHTETAHTRAEAVTLYRPEPMPGHPLETRTAAAPVSASIPTVVEVRTLDGRTVYHYAEVPEPAGAEVPAAAPTGSGIPVWAKTTSLLLVSASAALALAALAMKWFAEAAATLVASLLLLAKVAIVLAFVVALVAAVVHHFRPRSSGRQTATATATATAGLFGRAKATATASINNR